MSKKGGKDGGGSMDKEKELGKLYKELGALRCSPESHNTEYFQSKNLLSWNLCDRPTEDFDPEQEDWEKAVKVRASFVFLSHLFNFCRQVCNKILNLDSNDMTAFQCKVRPVWRFNEILFVMKDIWSFM